MNHSYVQNRFIYANDCDMMDVIRNWNWKDFMDNFNDNEYVGLTRDLLHDTIYTEKTNKSVYYD